MSLFLQKIVAAICGDLFHFYIHFYLQTRHVFAEAKIRKKLLKHAKRVFHNETKQQFLFSKTPVADSLQNEYN